MQKRLNIGLAISLLFSSLAVNAGQLVLVFDDFGYRPTEERKILQMSPDLSIAVLPTAPHAKQMANLAHQRGHEVLIHMPMVPISKQPLEKNTLTPEMSAEQISAIIHQAVQNVPYAVGMNNHMGSRMTSSLPGMQKVMQALNHYNLYFLDSVTIGSTQAAKAAQGTNVKVLRRRVFLDDNQNENEIRHQFQRAIQLARKNSYVIAIGHPHPSTVRVLQEMLPTLPTDIRLARPSQVLGLTPMPTTNRPPSVEKNSFVAKLTQRCRARHALNAPKPADAVQLIYQSVKESQLVHTIRALFR